MRQALPARSRNRLIALGVLIPCLWAGTGFEMPRIAAASPPAAADAVCPRGWDCRDVGPKVPAGGSESVNTDGSWTIAAGGTGIHGAGGPDELRLISRSVVGDNQTMVQILGQSNQGTLPQAGIMERESTDAGAPFYAAFMMPRDPTEHETQPKLVIMFRRTPGAARTELTKVYPLPYPRYVLVTRRGNAFNTSFSSDGVYWNLIPGTQTTVSMANPVMTGLAVNSGAQTQLGTARVAHLAVNEPGSMPLHPKPTRHPCPAGWLCGDTDDIAPQGDQTLVNGTWTVFGAGRGIGRTPDRFHFVFQSVPGDVTISAELTSIGTSSPGAKAGLMIRQTTDPSAAFYGIVVTPGTGGWVQWRTVRGVDVPSNIALASLHAPTFLRIRRVTDTSVVPAQTVYTAYTSSDGAAWVEVPGSTRVINMGTAPALGGLVGTANKSMTINPSTFTNFVIR